MWIWIIARFARDVIRNLNFYYDFKRMKRHKVSDIQDLSVLGMRATRSRRNLCRSTRTVWSTPDWAWRATPGTGCLATTSLTTLTSHSVSDGSIREVTFNVGSVFDDLYQEEPVTGSASLSSGVPFTVHRYRGSGCEPSRQPSSLVRVSMMTRQWLARKIKKGRQWLSSL